jgi:hypothetical protein
VGKLFHLDPNKIDLNGLYQAVLYKIEIKDRLDDFWGLLSYVYLDNDK